MTEVARLRHIRVVETETFWDCEISGLSRPRLFETMKCQGCRDWDSSRLRNLKVVETETSRDWSKVVETETFPRVSLISAVCTCMPSLCVQPPHHRPAGPASSAAQQHPRQHSVVLGATTPDKHILAWVKRHGTYELDLQYWLLLLSFWSRNIIT